MTTDQLSNDKVQAIKDEFTAADRIQKRDRRIRARQKYEVACAKLVCGKCGADEVGKAHAEYADAIRDEQKVGYEAMLNDLAVRPHDPALCDTVRMDAVDG